MESWLDWRSYLLLVVAALIVWLIAMNLAENLRIAWLKKYGRQVLTRIIELKLEDIPPGHTAADECCSRECNIWLQTEAYDATLQNRLEFGRYIWPSQAKKLVGVKEITVYYSSWNPKYFHFDIPPAG